MALLFDTHVQKMKYNVLREVAKLAYSDELTSAKLMEVSKTIIPDGKPMFRCCIYKERAIINERVGMALGGEEDGTVVSVLPIACDECPVDGIQVSAACRGSACLRSPVLEEGHQGRHYLRHGSGLCGVRWLEAYRPPLWPWSHGARRHRLRRRTGGRQPCHLQKGSRAFPGSLSQDGRDCLNKIPDRVG